MMSALMHTLSVLQAMGGGEGAGCEHRACPAIAFAAGGLSEEGVRLNQKTQVGPCIPVGIQL